MSMVAIGLTLHAAVVGRWKFALGFFVLYLGFAYVAFSLFARSLFFLDR